MQQFEYTSECCIFDLLHVRLYHGWLVDPADAALHRAVGQCGYNQLVDKVITNKSSDDPTLAHDGGYGDRDGYLLAQWRLLRHLCSLGLLSTHRCALGLLPPVSVV